MQRAILILCATALASSVYAQTTPSTKDKGLGHTVFGPVNPDLRDGALELRQGDPELGITLTRRGLSYAKTQHEKYSAYSNLCAGYILITKYQDAISFCDQALSLDETNHHALSNRALARFYLKSYDKAQADVQAGLAVAPHSRTLKRVAQMIRDAVDPVVPDVEVEHETAQ